VAEISERRQSEHGVGAEHPQCDKMQLVMILLFFAVWGIDSASFFVSSYSTVVGFIPLLVKLFLAVATSGIGLSLVKKSHRTVLSERHGQVRLIDTGVYARIRHPMYLGTLLVLLAFFFAVPSLLSLVVWIAFFIFFDN
jgi:protein-S-isoprenylcysteine O-methyltransferase Ste14